MNFKKLQILLLMAVVVIFTACYPDENEIPNSKGTEKSAQPFLDVNAVSGSWKLQSVVQYDENAIVQKQPTYMQSITLSDLYTYDVTLNLNAVDSANKWSTFSVIQNGDAPFYIPSSGSWRLNLNVTPRVQFQSADTAITFIPAPAYRVSDNKLSLKLERNIGTTKLSSYVYTFTRSN